MLEGPDGTGRFRVTIPQNLVPGDMFEVAIPAAPPVAIATPVATPTAVATPVVAEATPVRPLPTAPMVTDYREGPTGVVAEAVPMGIPVAPSCPSAASHRPSVAQPPARPSVPANTPPPSRPLAALDAPRNQEIACDERRVTIVTSAMEQKNQLLPDSIDETKLTLIHGFICCNTSLLCHEGCVGVAGKCGLLCCEAELCLKCDTDPLTCFCCALRCVPLSTCLKCQCQKCCLVSSASFPPDDEVPCTLALFFLACAPKCGCCMTLGELTEEEITVTVRRESQVAGQI